MAPRNRPTSFPVAKWIGHGRCGSLGLALALAVSFFCSLPTNGQQTSSANSQQGRQLTLQQQLTFGLKAVTPSDKSFIDDVVVLVQQGILPRSLVDSTFLWARERANAKSYSRSLRPMVYFRPGLIARAKRLGITL